MQQYNEYLGDIERLMKTEDVTYSNQLATLGRELFPKEFKGVFARNKQPRGKKGYWIVNLDKSSEPGSHWCGVANGLFYDSFGRNEKLGMGYKDYTEPDPEQAYQENNCGQRSLAWLCVYHADGPRVARTI